MLPLVDTTWGATTSNTSSITRMSISTGTTTTVMKAVTSTINNEGCLSQQESLLLSLFI